MTSTDSTDLPFSDALWALRRRWPLLLLVVALAGGGALVASLRMTPTYSAKAILMIRRPPEEAFGIKELYGAVAGDAQRFYRTQYDLLRGRTLVGALMQDPSLDPGSWPEYRAFTGEALLDRVRRNIRVEAREESFLVDVSFSGRDPARTAGFVNRLAEEFARRARETSRRNQTSLASLVSDQLREAQDRLVRSQDSLQAFEVAQDVAAFEERQALLVQDLRRLHEAAAELQLGLAALEPGYRPVQAALAGGGDLSGFHHPLLDENARILRLRDRLQELGGQALARAQTHGEADATLRGLRGQLAEVASALAEERRTILRGVALRYEDKAREMERVEGLRAAKHAELIALDRKRREHELLREQVQNHKELYLSLFRKEREVGLAGMEDAQAHSDLTEYVRVESPAPVPTRPSKPDVHLNLALGLTLGLLGGFVLVFLLGRVDDAVRGREDLERAVDLGILGTVPAIGQRSRPDEERDLVTHADPRSLAAESYRAIRTNLCFAGRGKELRTLLVTSAGPREGKTTCSANLAIAMAQAGRRVLLVDTDLRNPRLHRAFGTDNETGVSLHALEDLPPETHVRPTAVPNLSFLPSGPLPSNPAEILETPRLRGLFEALRARYDLLILDSPPVEAVTDASVLAGVADGTLAVVRAGHTGRRALARTLAALRGVHATVLGLVLNEARSGRGYASKYYAAYHSHGRRGKRERDAA